ncbi:hypothetical protein KP509_21G084500 [Ceratopteris richardii]|uniref:Uncharacterized protein n=1 Tax=Ceratopteris richardii TaxID=49495 RepID=A0A8T2SE36_CERRI|nr:hypothetical protein KP509_21G084500 [Ceratopteris richardii]
MAMYRTAVRLFSKTARNSLQAPKSRSALVGKKPVDPKVPFEEACRLADILYSILSKQGPLTTAGCWNHVQSQGFKSKGHMKVILKWMKERNQIRLVGKYKNKKVDDEDSMRYATMFFSEAAESVQTPDVDESESD